MRLPMRLKDVEIPGRYRKVGPSLRYIKSKVDYDWLLQLDPQAGRLPAVDEDAAVLRATSICNTDKAFTIHDADARS